MNKLYSYKITILLLFLVVIPSSLFWNGLLGPFLLDDFGNIDILAKFDALQGYTWYNYLADAPAGGLGRPLSFLSFLAQIDDWPNNPFAFKFVNLLIHLIIGGLILIFARQLLKAYGCKNYFWLSLLVAFLWLIHPIQQSTVFYPVQRMAQLSTLFMVLGIVLLVYLRQTVALISFKSFIVYSLVIGSCLSLATLSKENGILLCLFIWLVDHHLFKDSYIRGAWSKCFYLILVCIPMLLFVIYVIFTWGEILLVYQKRDFSLYERLLTESRVLLDYIRYLVIPNIGGRGLFYDDYAVSRDLFSPLSTLFCVIVLCLMLLLSLLIRKKYPIISFGFFWYLLGHLIESTIFPLEIYFEHRNYFPSIGLFIAFSYIVFKAYSKHSVAVAIGISVYIGLLCFLSMANAKIWKSEEVMAHHWAEGKSYSVRATQFLGNSLMNRGEKAQALALLDGATELMPNELGIRGQHLLYACYMSNTKFNSMNRLIIDVKTGKNDNSILTTLSKIIKLHSDGRCDPVNSGDLHALLNNLLLNPKYQYYLQQSNIRYLIGILYSIDGNLDLAMKNLDIAFSLFNNTNIVLLQVGWLASAGLYEDALRYVDKAEKYEKENGFFKYKNLKEIRKFREKIIIEMNDNNLK